MPWGGAPSTSDADAVRVLVGDTDASAPLLADDTYTLILAQESSLYGRGSLAASMLAGKYATQMTKRIGDFWREAKVLYEHYRDLAAFLRQESSRRTPAIPFSGGTSQDDVDTRNDETDRVKPAFEIGMLDSIYVNRTTGDEE